MKNSDYKGSVLDARSVLETDILSETKEIDPIRISCSLDIHDSKKKIM